MNKVINVTFDVDVSENNDFGNLKLIQALRKAIDKEIGYFGYAYVLGNFGDKTTLQYIKGNHEH